MQNSSRTTSPVNHQLITQARAVGYWDAALARFERLLVSHGYRAAHTLTNRELAARVVAEREAKSRLTRHIELVGGAL